VNKDYQNSLIFSITVTKGHSRLYQFHPGEVLKGCNALVENKLFQL